MATLLWILGAIFLLNVLIAGWLVTLELVERRRLDREIKEVDTLWRSLTMPSPQTAGWGSPLGVGTKQRTPVLHRLPAPPRSVGKASVGLAVAASALWVVVAALGPGEPGPVVSARGLESPALQAGERDRKTDPSSATGAEGISGTAAPPQASSGMTSSDAIPTSGAAAAPAAVAAEAHSSTAIHLAWAVVPAATGYEVDRMEKDSPQGWLEIIEVPESVTSYMDGGLDAGTTYFYKVSAITESGEALASDVVSATTSGGAVATATSVTAVAALDTVTLTWIDVGDETGYRIERSPDGTNGWAMIGTAGQDVTFYTDTALSAGTTYFYRIVATNAAGDSAPSNIVRATTETERVAEPPADGSATPSDSAPAGDVPSGGASAEDALVATESPDVAPAGSLA
ncbi:MAG: fibronectin type III domain-containing protein [Actinomycetota bacterium]|nr:fibronectin type III domain-containing protein [Actinomycetota bacterium]